MLDGLCVGLLPLTGARPEHDEVKVSHPVEDGYIANSIDIGK